MKIAIRVDASVQIGSGHFMRCLTLADALRDRGAEILFVSRHLPEHLGNMLKDKGHGFALLNNTSSDEDLDELAHAHWLGVSQSRDAEDSVSALANDLWDWLIVDHYALDWRWQSTLRGSARQIMVIDDLADRQHDCDVLLDQNFYAAMDSRYSGKIPAHCRLLLGPRYTLLRDEFRQVRESITPRRGQVKGVLVFFGGVDASNYTGRAVEALADLGIEGVHVDVVIGAQHPHRQQIEMLCAEHQFNCHVQTNRMAELMAAADLGVGAGGSATWERCCLGLPTLAFCTADNQQQQLVDAASEGLLYGPEVKEELRLVIKRHTRSLLGNSSLRTLLSRNGMQAVDGRGVHRVIGNMGCGGIEIRRARAEDSERLFAWRNHPTIRAVSRNVDLISWEEHTDWLALVLSDPKRFLLIGHRDGKPVGVVRFDVENYQAEVSIYLVPETDNRGSGFELLQSAERWFSSNCPEVNSLRAHVLVGNEVSERLFVSAGYQLESTSYLKGLH